MRLFDLLFAPYPLAVGWPNVLVFLHKSYFNSKQFEGVPRYSNLRLTKALSSRNHLVYCSCLITQRHWVVAVSRYKRISGVRVIFSLKLLSRLAELHRNLLKTTWNFSSSSCWSLLLVNFCHYLWKQIFHKFFVIGLVAAQGPEAAPGEKTRLWCKDPKRDCGPGKRCENCICVIDSKPWRPKEIEG